MFYLQQYPINLNFNKNEVNIVDIYLKTRLIP